MFRQFSNKNKKKYLEQIAPQLHKFLPFFFPLKGHNACIIAFEMKYLKQKTNIFKFVITRSPIHFNSTKVSDPLWRNVRSYNKILMFNHL